jgi:hypothetical protein
MKEIHAVITAEIEDRHAKVKVASGNFVFSFDGAVSYTGEPVLFSCTLVYFPSSKTVSYELTEHAIRGHGVVLLRETSGSLVPSAYSIMEAEKQIRKSFPLYYPAIFTLIKSAF